VNTEKRPLLKKRWSDLPDVTVNAYTPLEITAEKLRCILQRLQCRDLLDLALLFEEGVDPTDAAELFRRKAAHRRLDASSFADRYEQRVVDYEPRWDRELADSLGEVLHFDEVERSVRRALRKAQLL
jgi:predicted nucleotidyltransferase component of viral defense system